MRFRIHLFSYLTHVSLTLIYNLSGTFPEVLRGSQEQRDSVTIADDVKMMTSVIAAVVVVGSHTWS